MKEAVSSSSRAPVPEPELNEDGTPKMVTNTLILGRIRVSHELGSEELFCSNVNDDNIFTLPYWNIPFYFTGLTKKQVDRAYDALQNRYDVIIDTIAWKLYRPGPPDRISGLDFSIYQGGSLEKETKNALIDLDRVNDLAEDYMSKNRHVTPLVM